MFTLKPSAHTALLLLLLLLCALMLGCCLAWNVYNMQVLRLLVLRGAP
jgi:hypothetical protein